jgi:glutamate dehydrogenase (NAD(P)+)
MQKIERKIKEAFTNVQSTASAEGVDWRTAAYIIAIKRIETAYTERGIFP